VKKIDDIDLAKNEKTAVREAARLLREKFKAVDVILFGSKVRGEDTPESDIDLLVLTSEPVTWTERKAIIDALYEIELAHDVIISILIATAKEWKEGAFSVLPIHQEVSEHGAIA
jgi:predicted nucleotidyltransferase